jgi:signal transduction histidine kinase
MDAMSPAPLVSHVLPGAKRAFAPGGMHHLVVGPNLGPPYWWSLLATVILIVPTIWLLRRRPLWTLGLLLACAAAVSLAPSQWQIDVTSAMGRGPLPSTSEVLILLLVTTIGVIAATRPRWTSVAAVGVTVGLVAGGLAVQTPYFVVDLVVIAAMTVIAWLIGNSIRQSRIHAETLRAQAEAQAATAERLRIARELHDMVAHSIGIIAIQAGVGGRVIDTQPIEAHNALTAIETTSRETLAGLRRMLGALRQAEPGAATPLDPALGLADVGKLAATTADAGVLVEVQWHGPQRPLPAEIDTSAFRIIQEAVTNVVRHAGTAECQVSIDHQDDELAIEVLDDGRGGAVVGGGYGIAGMRERVGLLNGQFTAGPRPGGGFRVAARLPVPAGA